MLDQSENAITFREGLANPKRNWGALHEVGHEFLPWQRELLYSCPLSWLPETIQKQFESEADIFAAESFFFGSQFSKSVKEGDQNLKSAIDLADNVYLTSKHATIRHYVETSDIACCLIVWKPDQNAGTQLCPKSLTIHYYVPSKSFSGHIKPGQLADPDDAITKIFNDVLINNVVDHELTFEFSSGIISTAQGQSFSNTYNVLTLIADPVEKPLQIAKTK